MKGHLAPDVAKKIDPELINIERYIENFERIKALSDKKYDEYKISRFTGLTIQTVREYLDIIKIYYSESNEDKCKN